LKRVRQKIFFIFGFISLALGSIGVFLPLMPTTPFILLAAYLFARSSVKYHDWLRNNRLFGRTLRAWEAGEGLTLGEKKRMVIFATVVIAISFIICPNVVGRVVLAIAWFIPLSIAVFSRTRRR